MNVTVSPALINSSVLPSTFPVPSWPAVAFQPILVKAVTNWSAVTNLPLVVLAVGTPLASVVTVPTFGVNVIVSPSAATSNKLPSLDLTVNLIPPSLFNACPSVSPAAVSPFLPANLIVFLTSPWIWLPLIASVDVSEISPGFTFVIFTGVVSSEPDTLISPASVLLNLGPWSPPTCTVLNVTLSFVANVIFPFVSCFTSRFLPATNSTVLPALMDSPFASTVLPVFLVPSVVALAFNVNAALFTAFTTESTVAILPVSPSFTFTVPGLAPVVTDSMSPVLTFKPFSSVVKVLSPALTFKPASVTSKDLSAGLTLTPLVSTVKDLSAAFTVILLLLSLSSPLPRFTLYFTVDVLPSALSTATDVPSPLTKFTVSYGFTKSTALPSP